MKKIFCFLFVLILPFEPVSQAKLIKTNRPYSYEVLEHDLQQIKKEYKKDVEIKSIGTSHFGRNIWAVKLGKGKKNIVLIGSHHGREWLTSMLLMKMLDTYAEAFKENERVGFKSTRILNEVSIWFVPMLNPDGVSIQQHNFRNVPPNQKANLYRMNDGSKNFERWKANGIGIDLNRQYPAGWGNLNQGPVEPYYQFFKGKEPLEAKEVLALTKFIKEIDPSIAAAYHTAGREIFWKYHNGNQEKRDKSIVKKVANLTGYKLGKPPKEAVGGGFTDWFISTYHRPAMTIEISYLVGEKSPPLSVFKTEWKRNRYVGLKLAAEAKKIND